MEVFKSIKTMATSAVFEKLLQSRALLFSLESLPLLAINAGVTGIKRQPPSSEEQQALIKEAQKLFKGDADNFAKGIYPSSLFMGSLPPKHLLGLPEIYFDSFRAAFKRKDKKSKIFDASINKELEDYPEYYTRNFHYQTDGYLSEASAKRYDLQVELLFRGMADPMRRSLLKPMVGQKPFGRILEVGCGTGAFTSMLAQTFPESHITGLDMSPHYIQHAKKNSSFKNVDFVVGRGEDLVFKDNQFDAVVSMFLFHELPLSIRQQVIAETQRVLRPNGFWGAVDSLQLGDTPIFDRFLEKFPVKFHEPYFKNYTQNPLSSLLGHRRPILEESHFMAKLICTKKIEVLT